MSTANYRFITLRQPAAKLIPQPDSVARLDVDFANSIPELAESFDGWELVDTQLIPFEGDVLIFCTLQMVATAPESPGGIPHD